MVKGTFADAGLLGRHGLSMIEAMIALLILTVVSSGIVLLSLQVLALTYSSRLKNQSVTYAEQMLELVQNYYQANSWGMFSNYGRNGTQCYVNLSWNPPSSGTCVSDCSNPALLIPGQQTFFRYLLVTTTGNTSIQVSTVVTWMERGVCKPKTQLDTYYYNY